jgi:hypothetical protein
VREWLHTRGRGILSLLSDLGGALGFAIGAVSLVAVAVVGAILVSVEIFPQPFLTFFLLGVALGAASLTLHLLGERLTPKPGQPDPPTPPPQRPDESHLVGTIHDNPYSRAAATQSQHNETTARKAMRLIREELRDNRRHVERASEDDIGRIQRITFQAWYDGEETLLEMADSVPHSTARHAYRELEGIQDVLYIRDSSTVLTRRKQPRHLLETDVDTTFEAIDAAIQKLSEAESS